MNSLVLTLDPDKLKNPDLDLRYAIPDLLKAQSKGNIDDDGYDYEDQDNQTNPLLIIFLTANDLSLAMATIIQFIRHERVLGNDLSSAAALYIEKKGVRSKVPFI
ncbi:hypothetical protein HA050_05500 [Iodobacter sp. HSC-16F04]|uniref:Uncharacterized protein n=1 Tax=Iodobacter violaceini TaxID=3044271 RepID=A0ABX0KTW6_9NEIS|nr:hypothetical protein [Iodobacter violacea]NHQ85572.1 hypothetical protein [Iodobacter violacea]